MSIPTFTPGYPPDGFSLGATKAVIRDNLDGTFLTLGVDHINNNGDPGANPAGYHNVIHMVEQSAVPTPEVGITQVFSMIPPSGIPGGDVQLFSLSGGGGLSQLTGNLNTTDGYQWIGGVLVQWGFDPVSAASTGSISFPVPFPTQALNVQISTVSGSGIPIPPVIPFYRWVVTGTLLQGGFDWQRLAGPVTTGMYWIAIGF